MPPSLHDDTKLAELRSRIRDLDVDAKPLWGKMSAHQMLCHVGDQLRVALGDLPAQDHSKLHLRTLVRFLVIHTGMDPPKGKIETLPVMQTTQPGSWADDRDALLVLLQRVADADELRPHPAFGNLSVREWGILSARHLGYHLRQFGV